MKKTMVAIGAVFCVAVLSSAASADQATGAITKIDDAAGTVTLENGKVYFLTGALSGMIMVGDVVNVTFKADATGKLMASDVQEAYAPYP
jgi:hypothetical protein